MRDTRTHAIHAHVLLALRHTGTDQVDFAADVVAHYQERTPLHAQLVEFHGHVAGTDPYEVRRANHQKLWRMLRTDGPVRLPADLEEAVVLALPQPFRHECLRELSARYGLLPVPLPADGAATGMACVGAFSSDFGEALQALSRTLADGRLQACDAKHAPDAIRCLEDVIAQATSLRAAHQALLKPHLVPATGLDNREGQEV